jgi:peptidoglycan/xylan/chitin deacetylase (PgdA/CDA1 family)
MVAQRVTLAGSTVAMRSRRFAKTLAEATLPRSMAAWRGPAHSRRVALTFDDGPTALTRDYLDVLDSVGARATFFVVGAVCANNADILSDVARRGHELAGHGYTHRTFPRLSKLGLLDDELEQTAQLLPSDPKTRPMVRPPHGAVSLMSLVTCARAGYTTVFWSLDSGDWRTTRAADVVAAVLGKQITPGTIVLFHDGQAWTVDALRTIVVRLKEAGHELVTVGELLAH